MMLIVPAERNGVMNKHNIPWIRSWEQPKQTEEQKTSFWMNCLTLLVFVAACWGCVLVVADGLDRSAIIAVKEAKAKQLGRVEMLAEVNAAYEREGRTLETYYRWASKKGTTGFDGLALAEKQ